MTLITQAAAASEATLQTDLLRNSVHRLAGYDRVITGVAFSGSDAAGDAAVEVYVSDVLVGTFYNFKEGSTGSGGPASAYQMYPTDAYVPAGSEIRATVIDAPATNPVLLVMELDEPAEDDLGMAIGDMPI